MPEGTTVKAHFDGKVFVPDEPVRVPVGTSAVVEMADNAERNAPRKGGWLLGKGRIAPDFDDLGEAFADYT